MVPVHERSPRPALLCVLDRVESGQQMTAGVVLAVCGLVSLAMWGLIIVGILTVLGVL